MSTPETEAAAKPAAKPAAPAATKPAATKTAPKTPAKPAAEKKPAEPVTTPPAAGADTPDVIGDALSRVASPAAGAEPTADATDAAVVSLPPTLAFIEDVPNTFNGTAFEVRLYGEGCLDCKHLVPSAAEGQNDCHFSNGNQFCPAAFNRIVFVGTRQRFIARINKAQAAGDSNRVLGILRQLEKEDIDTKNYVLKEVGLLKAN